jgi:hypothetical protein
LAAMPIKRYHLHLRTGLLLKHLRWQT